MKFLLLLSLLSSVSAFAEATFTDCPLIDQSNRNNNPKSELSSGTKTAEVEVKGNNTKIQ